MPSQTSHSLACRQRNAVPLSATRAFISPLAFTSPIFVHTFHASNRHSLQRPRPSQSFSRHHVHRLPSNPHRISTPVRLSAVGRTSSSSPQSPLPGPIPEAPLLKPNANDATPLPPINPQPISNAEIDSGIAKIALPALGTLALDPLVALADMACVGYLGATALGGVGIGNNVFNISFTCFNFLGLATTPAIARAFARSDEDEASRLIAQALWVALISGVSATFMLSIFTRPVLQFFGANALILPHAVSYLRARLVAAPFFLAAMVGNGTFRGFQDTRTPLFVGLFANLLNLFLYPTLIFAFKMGTRGAGMAMATGQICAGIALFAMMLRTRKLRLKDLKRPPRLSEVLPLLRTGAVLSVRTLSIYSTVSYATATAARLGTIEVAAFEIGRQIFALFARLLDAISVAAQALVALALGKDDYSLARRTSNRILRVGVAMGCGFVALLMLIVNAAPLVFTTNPAVRSMVSLSFPFMAFVQPVNGLVFVFDGLFTAGRRFSILSTSIFIASVSASAFLYLVRSRALPLQYVWIGLNIMMILRASILGFFYFTKWSPVPRQSFVAARANGTPPK